jgi:hypothetical protein
LFISLFATASSCPLYLPSTRWFRNFSQNKTLLVFLPSKFENQQANNEFENLYQQSFFFCLCLFGFQWRSNLTLVCFLVRYFFFSTWSSYEIWYNI